MTIVLQRGQIKYCRRERNTFTICLPVLFLGLFCVCTTVQVVCAPATRSRFKESSQCNQVEVTQEKGLIQYKDNAELSILFVQGMFVYPFVRTSAVQGY